MRTLRFIVDKQIIRKDAMCNFSGIVPGTEGYLEAEFNTSDEWNGCAMAAVFYRYGKEYPAAVIDGKCTIPSEALKKLSFDVMLVGEKDGYRICTNREEVRQNG